MARAGLVGSTAVTGMSVPTRVPAARVREAVERLGAFAAEISWDDVPDVVRERLLLVLLDTLGVIAAGAATPEQRRLVTVTAPPPGPASVIGGGCRAPVEVGAWLNGIAVCCLELDEGNKHARGHPAAHVVPAALAVAQDLRASGPELLAAVLAGYEVAARLGQATSLHPGIHPHGNWGVAGAAAAVARLRRLTPEQVAGAVDAATGLTLATHFGSALDGNLTRNAWVGAANVSGIAAARLAEAGLAVPGRTPQLTLGELLGDLDANLVDAELGQRWDVARGYFKRHASCAYTHPPADAALELRRDRPDLAPDAITSIAVETHHLAAALDRRDAPTRLAAMFSIPYVVAVALITGDCRPERFDDVHRQDPAVRRLAEMTDGRRTDAFDARLPDRRGARLSVRLQDGSEHRAEVANPIGDVDHHPFGPAEVRTKLADLLPAGDLDTLTAAVAGLAHSDDVAPLIERLQ